MKDKKTRRIYICMYYNSTFSREQKMSGKDWKKETFLVKIRSKTFILDTV